MMTSLPGEKNTSPIGFIWVLMKHSCTQTCQSMKAPFQLQYTLMAFNIACVSPWFVSIFQVYKGRAVAVARQKRRSLFEWWPEASRSCPSRHVQYHRQAPEPLLRSPPGYQRLLALLCVCLCGDCDGRRHRQVNEGQILGHPPHQTRRTSGAPKLRGSSTSTNKPGSFWALPGH